MATSSIITLLKKDHKEVSGLLKEALATSDKAAEKRMNLFTQIYDVLTFHASFEEENLYPILLEKNKAKDDASEAEAEHAQIKHLLAEISTTEVTDERWKARVMVLAGDIRHHVNEEETSGGLFDELKKLDDEELAGLAEQYEANNRGHPI